MLMASFFRGTHPLKSPLVPNHTMKDSFITSLRTIQAQLCMY